ncbi:hypothetical protein ACTPEW_16285 [Clostridioides difficile]
MSTGILAILLLVILGIILVSYGSFLVLSENENKNLCDFLDKDENIVKSLVLNKKYDILGDRSYTEYSKKDSTLEFEKIKKTNGYIYKLK